MASQNQQALLNYDGQSKDDQPQAQLHREEVGHGQTQNSSIVNQTGDSMKTMAYGAADIASGAARGAMGLAQGAAMGAANLAQGATTAVKNTFGNNPENNNDLHTPLPTANPQNPRY